MAFKITKKQAKQAALFIAGWIVLILGVALILDWWAYVVVVFKGCAGILMALVGLLILVLAKG
ncbi:MAG TPA: hypothetical protein PL155_03735 [Candidatus Omnitrophota bacterium]|nr:hypothetical protein [Candidatus Omnitrophota bacterium]HPD84411.1 hypothetical protein [Candidatus Omnitrophota bacterium]HRZ03269.1 hypothetical protein [Candidatus Omnitrophota bacterium]